MKSMKNTFITLLTLLSLGGAAYAKPSEEPKDSTTNKEKTEQTDKFSGNLELIKSTEPNNSYVRTNMFYDLPADISGYNWTEFYTDGSIMGRNTLTKNVAGPVGVQNVTRYGGGKKINIGLGACVDISTDAGFIQLYAVPIFIDANGNSVKNNSIVGLYGERNITDNIKLSGFKEFNVAGKEGVEWDYGELNLEYIVSDNVSVSYNPAFFNDGEGKITPSIDHRFTFKYTFK